jgi:hypothetical protein
MSDPPARSKGAKKDVFMSTKTSSFKHTAGLIALLCVSGLTPASGHQIPKQFLGNWVEIGAKSGEADEVSVSVKDDELIVRDDIVQEGQACKLPTNHIKIETMRNDTKLMSLIQGRGVCQAEDNPPNKPKLILVYSNANATENLFIAASDGWTVSLRRKLK